MQASESPDQDGAEEALASLRGTLQKGHAKATEELVSLSAERDTLLRRIKFDSEKLVSTQQRLASEQSAWSAWVNCPIGR